MQASNVSARLRRAGFGVVSTRNREGIRVSKGALPGHVRISVDIDRPNEAARVQRHLAEWLGDNAAALGWGWEHSGDGLFHLQPENTPETRAAKRDAIAAEYDEPDGAPHGAHLVTDPYDASSYSNIGQQRSTRVKRKLNDRAQQHAFSVRHAMANICTAVYDGKPPRQADIDMASRKLDALVTLAQDWAR